MFRAIIRYFLQACSLPDQEKPTYLQALNDLTLEYIAVKTLTNAAVKYVK